MAYSEFDANRKTKEPTWAQPSRCRRSLKPRPRVGLRRVLSTACIRTVLSAALLMDALRAWIRRVLP